MIIFESLLTTFKEGSSIGATHSTQEAEKIGSSLKPNYYNKFQPS